MAEDRQFQRWRRFIESAGIKDSPTASEYASFFCAGGLQEGLELSKETLSSLGIQKPGHQIKLIKHASKCCTVNQDVVGNYIALQTLGDGTHHVVKLGLDRLSGKIVALKILRKDHWRQNPTQWWENPTRHEKELLERCRDNPFVIKLIDACFDVSYTGAEGSRFTTHVLVLENALCNLCDVIADSTPFEEPEALGWFQQLIQGVEACHKAGVMHRDLKPEQILFTDVLDLKISDFNFGEYLSAGERLRVAQRRGDLHPLVGTPKYMAPEVYELWLKRQRQEKCPGWYDVEAADVWGAGIILFYLLTGNDPFPLERPAMEDPRFKALAVADYAAFWLHLINFGEHKEAVARLSQPARELIQGILHPDARLRFTVGQIRQHRWFKLPAASKAQLYWSTRRRYMREPARANSHSEAAPSGGPDPAAMPAPVMPPSSSNSSSSPLSTGQTAAVGAAGPGPGPRRQKAGSRRSGGGVWSLLGLGMGLGLALLVAGHFLWGMVRTDRRQPAVTPASVSASASASGAASLAKAASASTSTSASPSTRTVNAAAPGGAASTVSSSQ